MLLKLLLAITLLIASLKSDCPSALISNLQSYGISPIITGGFVMLRMGKTLPSTITAYVYSRNGDLLTSKDLVTVGNYADITFSVTGLSDGTVAICTKTHLLESPKGEIRYLDMTIKQAQFNIANENDKHCHKGIELSSSNFLFILKDDTTQYLYHYTNWVEDVGFSLSFSIDFDVKADTGGFVAVAPDENARYYEYSGTLQIRSGSNYRPSSTSFIEANYYKKSGTLYEFYAVSEVEFTVIIFQPMGPIELSSYVVTNTPLDKTQFSVALNPGNYIAFVCYYSSDINCYLFDLSTGFLSPSSTVYTSTPTCTVSELKVINIATGMFVLLYKCSDDSLTFVIIGPDGSCTTPFTPVTTCPDYCSSTCLNFLGISFCDKQITCVSNFYQGGSGDCEICSSTCKSCTAQSTCTSCYTDTYLEASQCGSTCPSDKYSNSTTNTCETCNSTCSTCTSSTSCSDCKATYFLHNSACDSSCPAGYRQDSANRVCVACIANCDTCTGSTDCSLCSSSYYYNNASCESSCPNGAYANVNDRVCYNCTAACSSCTDYSTCTACNTDFYLLGTSCLDTCPTGKYADSILGACLSCQANCDSCTNGVSCTLCTSGFYWDGSACSSSCPAGKYANATTRICDPCANGCSSCVYHDGCLVCLNPFTEADMTCPCPKGSRLDLSLVCQSVSYLYLDQIYTISTSYLLIRGAVLDEETIAFPSRLYTWNVTSNSSNATLASLLSANISAQTSINLTIPYTIVEPDVQYAFGCSFTNAVSVTVSNISTIASLNYLKPTLTLSASLASLKRSNDISIQIVYSFLYSTLFASQCGISSNANFNSSEAVQADGVIHTISACTLSKNSTNQIVFSGYFIQNPTFIDNLIVSFSIGADSFYVLVDTLDRTQPSNLGINLTASIVINDSCPDSTTTGVTYKWECEKSTDLGSTYSACSDNLGLFGVWGSSNALSIPTSYYTADNILRITVTGLKEGVEASKSGLITIQGDRTLVLMISCRNPPCQTYNSNNDLYLTASIQNDPGISSLLYRWNTSMNISSTWFQTSFFMNADTSMYAGQIIHITVSIVDAIYSGSTKISLPINTSPINGTFIASPSTGISLLSNFSLEASAWEDADIPFKYQFSFVSFGVVNILTQVQNSSNYTTIISGQSPSQEVTFILTVYDAYNAPTSANANVTVYTHQQTFFQAFTSLVDLNLATNSSNPYQAVSQSALAISQLTHAEDTLAELREHIIICTGCPNDTTLCDYGICTCFNSSNKAVDCSMTEDTYHEIISYKTTLLHRLNNSFINLTSDSTTDTPEVAQAKESILNSIKLMTMNPSMMDDSLMVDILDFFDTTVQINSPSRLLTPAQSTQTTQIVSNLFGFTQNTDCNCTGSVCKGFENKTIALLDKVSQSSLSQFVPGQKPYSVSTENFDLSATRVSVCSINDVMLNPSESSPIISFQTLVTQNECSKTVDIQAYSFPSDTFGCNASASPAKDLVMVKIMDTDTGASFNDLVRMKLTMPYGLGCPSECTSPAVSQCTCNPDMFDIAGQMSKLFAASNLKAFNNIGALLNWTWYESPIFWANFGAFSWLVGSVLAFKCNKRLNNFCMVQKIENRDQIAPLKGALIMYLVINDIISIYAMKMENISKSSRALIYYLKIIFFSTYSAIFVSEPSSSDAPTDVWSILKNINIAVFLFPYVTVVPLHKIVKYVVISEASKNPGKIRSAFLFLIILILSLGCLFAMFVIAANKSSNSQLPWLVTFVSTFIQDVFLNSFMLIFLQMGLIHLKKKTNLRKMSTIRKYALKPVDDGCEVIYDRMGSMKSIPQVKTLNKTTTDCSSSELRLNGLDDNTISEIRLATKPPMKNVPKIEIAKKISEHEFNRFILDESLPIEMSPERILNKKPKRVKVNRVVPFKNPFA